jgi:hypothetical protein
MHAFLPVISGIAALALSAFVFLALLPRYFLGTRSGGGLAGFKDRREAVQAGALACFVSTAIYVFAAAFILSAPLSLGELGQRLGAREGTTEAAAFAARMIGSAIYRRAWAWIGIGALFEGLLILSIIVGITLSRDMSLKGSGTKEREHVLELDEEAREALERQEA